MDIIACSGSSKTGKSTAIEILTEIFHNQGKTVKVYRETAQMYIDKHPGPILDRYDFEQYIMEQEFKRIYEIQEIKEKQEYDIILIDRTFLDAFVYMYRGIIHGHITNGNVFSHIQEIMISKEIYDIIIFFDTMIVPDENFEDYNNTDINGIFKHTMHSIYGEKLVYYANNKEFEKNITTFLDTYIR